MADKKFNDLTFKQQMGVIAAMMAGIGTPMAGIVLTGVYAKADEFVVTENEFDEHKQWASKELNKLNAQIDGVSDSVDELKKSIDRKDLTDQIYNLEQEIFNLEMMESRNEILPEQRQRLNRLRSRLNQAERDLEDL